MPDGASTRAASTKARLYDFRLMLPANAAIRSVTSRPKRCQAQQQQSLSAPGARLQVLGHCQRLGKLKLAPEVVLELHLGLFAGPARRILEHWDSLLRCARRNLLESEGGTPGQRLKTGSWRKDRTLPAKSA